MAFGKKSVEVHTENPLQVQEERRERAKEQKKRTVRSSWRNTDKNGSDIDEIM